MEDSPHFVLEDAAHYMKLAYKQLEGSIDKKNGVGAIISHFKNGVVASGTNQLPPNIIDSEGTRTQPGSLEKEYWTEHAERYAIYKAAREGIPLSGCAIFTTLFPCHHCARAIILSGINKVVVPRLPDFKHKKFGISWRRSTSLLLESKIPIFILDIIQQMEGIQVCSEQVLVDMLCNISQENIDQQ